VVIPGQPPSLNKRYGHFMARHRDQAGSGSWKERARLLAQSARNEARWGLPTRDDRPRFLAIDTYRRGELDPFDNAPGSLKAIIDGFKRVLVWDDKPPWCHVERFDPHRVATAAEERTVIVVRRGVIEAALR
jgi:hypothetical protein